jgi:hypothetical protein
LQKACYGELFMPSEALLSCPNRKRPFSIDYGHDP